MFSSQELLRFASQDYILGNTTMEEQIAFVEDQIRSPFNSGDINYLKKLMRMVPGQDEMDEICKQFFTQIQDVYSGLEIDVNDYDQHLSAICMAIYKFFVKNVGKLMYVFIKEYLYNNKNRKGLIAEFSNAKIPNYPKEQYGKKDYYILITKLNAIVDEIFEDDIKLKKFIEYVEKSDKAPVYLDAILEAIEQGIVVDKGVVSDMYRLYKKSDLFRGHMNKLEMDITKTFIIPYLEENGMADVWLPPVEEIPEDLDESDEESDDE